MLPSARPEGFHHREPAELLELPATAFLCSTRCPGDKILAAYATTGRASSATWVPP